MREKSIKLSDYFELIKPQYIYIKITPHKSIRNYNSGNIVKAIADTYRSINRRITREKKKIFFETNFKISYIIDITNNNAKFYFQVPKAFKNSLMEKIKEIWTKATIEEVDFAPPSNFELYQLSYKKEDALSLQVDRKSNEPLNSILSIMEVMKENDRITIIYNFMPNSQFGWLEKYNKTMEKLKERKPIEKKQLTFEYITKTIMVQAISLLKQLTEVLNDLTGGTPTGARESLYTSILGVLEQQGELTQATKRKKEGTIISTQIAVLSSGEDKLSIETNARNVCRSYRSIDEDNELIYKKVKDKVKNKFDINNYDLGLEINSFSTDETSNFIQIPARNLLNYYKINHINVNENPLPQELKTGVKWLGDVRCKGETYKAYIENEYNIGNLPLVINGKQGSGKTTYLKHYAKECINSGESVIVIDFIKKCGLSNDIMGGIDKDKITEIDLGTEEGLQGLGYNEIEINDNMDNFTKLKYASMQSQQLMALIDSISTGDSLTSRMRRFLSASALVTYVLGYTSIKEVVWCLEDFEKRGQYINQLSNELKATLEEEVRTLKELDEVNNKTGQVVGTRESKIEHILDRISLLKEDIKLKMMYNKTLENNIDLIQAMEQGKAVFIKMKEDDFNTMEIKNIMVTYWISKIWLACQIRGGMKEKPLRCNIIIDEVFQAPTSLEKLKYILPQTRKFGLKFILSTQYIEQLDKISETLLASGASYMLLRGSTEKDFNRLVSLMENMEYEDLRDMKEYHSLNVINYSKGYSSFISNLTI